MHLCGIPLRSSQRSQNDPLIVAGGPCVLNPEPMAEFIDFFLIGEAEEALLEVIAVYRKLKSSNQKQKPAKEEFLEAIRGIEGVYIPSFYSVTYKADGTLAEFSPKRDSVAAKVKKRFIKDLEHGFYPLQWLIPFTGIVHDRVSLEVMRGCPNRCNFCQARVLYSPYRYKSPEKLVDLAKDLYRSTGYEEISLMGLSISDYSRIKALLEELINTFKEKKVSISFASLRAKTLLNFLVPLITEIKKT